MENSQLLVNLVLALTVALLGGTIAVRLRQSAILGYILAGIFISPYTPGFVGDLASVESLADIGVILLMFAIGMRLSLREFQGVGRVVVLGGGTQVVILIGIGYAVGLVLGWSSIESLFFGAVISNSSSTVITKILDDRGESDSIHGRLSIAWSTIQDLSTIILIVVLSTLAQGSSGNGLISAILVATAKAAVFLVVLLPIGSRILPWIFGHIAALQNQEIFIMAVAVFAIGTAYASSLFGLSLAIGAFVAGVVVSESDISHSILGTVTPLRDLFVGFFFVSVGMLVDVGFAIRHLPLVLLVLALIVLIKGPIAAGLIYLFRYPIRIAFLSGIALAQCAEFSLLMARVGADIGAVSPAVFSLMLAGSVASIIVAPSLHAVAAPAAHWMEQHQPLTELSTYTHTSTEERDKPQGHALICGYGQIGRMLAATLLRRGFSIVVIDQDRNTVLRLRERGIIALMGNADNPIILNEAGIAGARVLVVAIPDGLAARRIVDFARQSPRSIPIVARVQNEADREFMLRRGVNAAIIGERELALEITRHTLRLFGVSSLEALAIVQRLRGSDETADPDVIPG